MARALRGSFRSKREEKIMGRKRKYPLPEGAVVDTQDDDDTDFDGEGEVVDQPVSGESVGPAKETIVEAIEVPEDPLYTFTFAIEPTVGFKCKVIATRNDGEELENCFDTMDEGHAFINKKTQELRVNKAVGEEEKIEAAHQISNLTVLNVGPPKPAQGEVVLSVHNSKETLHLTPELAESVIAWLGDNKKIMAFNVSDNGVTLVSYPCGKKARFLLNNGKVVVS
jgi:hypothetical protein